MKHKNTILILIVLILLVWFVSNRMSKTDNNSEMNQDSEMMNEEAALDQELQATMNEEASIDSEINELESMTF